MKRLADDGTLFSHHPRARYATDVTFQQSNRPGCNLQEAKKYFSGKYKLYGYKLEVSVMPNGLAAMCSGHYPGSVSDIDIFSDMIANHKEAIKKRPCDEGIADIAPLHHKYPNQWLILTDKGYQGASSRIRLFHPKKKPAGGTLTAAEELTNKNVSTDRILVEIFF